MSSPEYDLAAADPHYLDSAGRIWGISTMLKVNIVTCSLSFAGCLVMIIPFVLSKHLRKIRHRLILGMAVNDLLQAASVLIPSVWSTYHGAIPTNSPGCNADSFFYLTFVVAGCFWTLSIAITTYITLVQPTSKVADCMHRSRSIYFIWVSIWLICVLNAGIGIALNVSVDGGGFCFFPVVAPHLYGNLVLFVPRAGTFAIIIFIYVRLYIFFRHQASSHHKQESGIHEASFHVPLPSPASELHLPMDQDHLRISAEERRSGSVSIHRLSSLIKTPSKPPEDQSTAMLRCKLAEYRVKKQLTRKDSDDSGTLVSTRRRFPGWSGKGRRQRSTSDIKWPENLNEAEEPLTTNTSNIEEGSRRKSGPVLQDSAEILNSPHGFQGQLVLLGTDGYNFPSDRHKTESTTTPQSESTLLRSGSNPPAEADQEPLARCVDMPQASTLRGIVSMGDGISPGADSLLTLASQPARSAFPGFAPVSQSEGAEKDSPVIGLWEALASVDPVDSDDAGLAKACVEKGRRLSASEENRRVSYLMLLYPLAYGIILAVSIARLAVTLATKASPSPWLQILNRVCVLGTGVVDAIIYTVIEWRFRASFRNAAHKQGETEEMRSK